MSRLRIHTKSTAQTTVEQLYKELERRITASPPGLCPVDMASAFLTLCHAQSCGKCVPCRVGLGTLSDLLEDVLDGHASMETISLIERTAQVIADTADCAIGFTAAQMVLTGIRGFRDDYEEHILRGRCLGNLQQPVPCVALCPAGVDIPGYIALVAEGRYADAVRLIRKDNPFPTACALVCEHPCEARCRRNMVDNAVNIRGMKLAAVDNAGDVPVPERAESTGKRVAIIGGGPSGLSAAYYLQLMGHQTTVYEMHKHLGGMLYYGIPSYRLPRERLDADINAILSTGVEVELNTTIGNGEGQVSISELREKYDAVYISIGAHTDKKVGLPGEDARGVLSAVELLGSLADGHPIDLSGKEVAVIGGGNVAMDATRSAIRLGAKKVSVVYRRRQADMTALEEEILSAVAEGAEILELHAPKGIETNEAGEVTAHLPGGPGRPPRPGKVGGGGRPHPLPGGDRGHRPGHRDRGPGGGRPHQAGGHRRGELERHRGRPRGLCRRRLRHRPRHRHPGHRRRQGGRGQYRPVPRLRPHHLHRRGDPRPPDAQQPPLRAHQREGALRRRAQGRLAVRGAAPDGPGDRPGERPLPAVRPLWLWDL